MTYCIFLRLKIALIFYLLMLPGIVLASDFPLYPVIRPNVAFWEKIYSKYSSSYGLIHHSENLNIIYEVVKIAESTDRRSRRRNQKKIRSIKEKYRTILAKLANGEKPSTPEERRVLKLFMPLTDRPTLENAINKIRFQRGQKNRFREGIIRSGAYLARIKRIFRKFGLPEELAYLPHVESSFNYQAYSKFGASGIWQFTWSTGRRFMRVNYTVDERRDPILATYAAASFLKENYELLGSWPLALTAYNHGANGMKRARDKYGSYEQIFKKYDGRRFGFASRNFYAEFLAAREIAAKYQSHFGPLVLDAPKDCREVKLKNYVPLTALLKHFKVDVNTIKAYNPALRKPVYTGQKYLPRGYYLRLPVKSGQDLKKLAENIPDNIFKNKQKRSRFCRVRRGDTAGVIARRHKVKLKDLIEANNLDRRATIYIGQNLRLPISGESLVLLSSTSKRPASKHLEFPAEPIVLASKITEEEAKIIEKGKNPATEKKTMEKISGSENILPEPVLTASVPAATVLATSIPADSTEPTEPAEPIESTKSTESIDLAESEVSEVLEVPLIGKKHPAKELPVNVEKTAEENGVLVAQEAVEAEKSTDPTVLSGDLRVERLAPAGGGGALLGNIRVEPGETLGHYADWLELPTQKLRKLNRLRFGKTIHLGQKVKLDFKTVSYEVFEERRYEYHKEREEDFFVSFKVDDVRIYRIKTGDSIWTLSKEEFEVPIWLIKKYNSTVDLNDLRAEQQLIIPVVVKKEG
jgi:membrane-bound lytic murein transglycosylase D